MLKVSDFLKAPPAQIEATASRQTIDDAFEEEPVPLTTFVCDAAYLNNPPLSPVQYEAVRYVEQIYYPSLYPAMVAEFGAYWEPVRMIHFATLEWGKGGGKDHVCRIISLRAAYLLLCLKSPQSYYGMPTQDTINLLNVAASAPQAQRAFFTPMTRAVRQGWFKDRAEPSTNTIKFDKFVEAVSGHSDAETQEGLNLLVAIADEIDAFKSREELVRNRGSAERDPSNSAEAILDMIQTSGSTRFPLTYKNVRISYPRYFGSTIQKLVAEGRADLAKDPEGSRHFVSGPLATWDVNPRVATAGGRKLYEKDYEKDPVLARAKYECMPARAIDPFFRNFNAVKGMFRPVDRDPLQFRYFIHTNEHGVEQWAVDFDFGADLLPIQGAVYALHADIGVKRDRCGLALCHISRMEEKLTEIQLEDGEVTFRTDVVPWIKADFVTSFAADTAAKPFSREVQINWILNLVVTLQRRGFAIGGVSFDSYQSTDVSQRLEALGFKVERLSTDLDPSLYGGLRDLVNDQRIDVPWRYEVQTEIEGLQLLPNGKIDHPPAGSKDESDALAAAAFHAALLGGEEVEDRQQAYASDNMAELVGFIDLPFGMEPVGFGRYQE